MRESISRCHEPGRKHRRAVRVQIKADELKALRDERDGYKELARLYAGYLDGEPSEYAQSLILSLKES